MRRVSLFPDIFSLIPCTAFTKLRLATLAKQTWRKFALIPKNYSQLEDKTKKSTSQVMWVKISYGLPISYFIYKNLSTNCKWYIFISALLFGYEKVWEYCRKNEKLTFFDTNVCIFYAAKGCHFNLLKSIGSRQCNIDVAIDGLIMGGHYDCVKNMKGDPFERNRFLNQYSLTQICTICEFFFSNGYGLTNPKSAWNEFSVLYISKYFKQLSFEEQITCAEFIVDWYALIAKVLFHDFDEYWTDHLNDIYRKIAANLPIH